MYDCTPVSSSLINWQSLKENPNCLHYKLHAVDPSKLKRSKEQKRYLWFIVTLLGSCRCNYITYITCFQGSGGVTIKKTNQALVIGIYEEPLTPGQCNMIVERLGDYLIDQGI